MSREARLRRKEIESNRREKVREVMAEYDSSVFHPALIAAPCLGKTARMERL